jgi:hypothetical protein
MGTIKQTFANNLTGAGKLSATGLDSNVPAANVADASVTNITALPEALGQAIKSVAGSPPTPVVGDVWYNNVIGVLQNYVTVAATWSSGGNLGTGRYNSSAAGIQNAAVLFGGNPFTDTTKTEEYNGSTWTAGNNMPVGRADASGAGTQTAALSFGGNASYPGFPQLTSTLEYDGTNWTSGGTLGTARSDLGGCGLQTAALGFGGASSPTAITNTEEYDGTSWTGGGSLGTARKELGSATAGTQTAALGFGGNTPPFSTLTDVSEEYNGTSWTAGGNYVAGTRLLSGAGTQTAALGFGGLNPAVSPSATGTTALYDGSSWTTSPASLSIGRYSATGVGTQTAALCAGGGGVPQTNATEEFTGAFNATRKVTTS